MGRIARTMAIAAVAVMLAVTPASGSTDPSPTVVIVLAPYLTWEHVGSGVAPALESLTSDAALASVNVRSGNIDAAPDEITGAAVLSAGRPLGATDEPATAAGVGELGGSVRAAGGRVWALGTSAASAIEAVESTRQPAWIVARDDEGRVDGAETGARMLRPASWAPFGLTTDLDVLEASYVAALVAAARDEGPALIVIDPGESSRARLAAEAGTAAFEPAAVDSARMIDAVVRIALRTLPPNAALVVVSTAQRADGGPPGFGPLILYGKGPGLLVSPGTRREGVVTLPDVTATVQGLLGAASSPAVTGSMVRLEPDTRTGAERRLALARADRAARSLEAVREPAWYAYLDLAVASLLMALAVVFLDRGGRLPAARRVLIAALLALLSFPVASLLARFAPLPRSPGDVWIALGVATGLLTAGAVAVLLARGTGRALGWVVAATAFVIVADQLTGARLAYGGVFSYSALFGTRFYGLGNEGAAVLIGALLVGVGGRIDRFGNDRAEGLWRMGVPLVAIAVLPMLGANFGVLAWGPVGILVAYLYARRLEPRLSWLPLLAGVAVVALASLVFIDALLPSSSHLGRLFGGLAAGPEGLAGLLERKVSLASALVEATPLVLALPAGLIAVLILLWRPAGTLGRVLAARPGVAAALAGTTAAAIVAAVTEDSGVVVSALLMLFGLAALLIAALETGRGSEAA